MGSVTNPAVYHKRVTKHKALQTKKYIKSALITERLSISDHLSVLTQAGCGCHPTTGELFLMKNIPDCGKQKPRLHGQNWSRVCTGTKMTLLLSFLTLHNVHIDVLLWNI